MIKLGITGGIGSGKSTITEILKLLGVPVYIADIESKRLTNSSPIIKEKLINLFGTDLYPNGNLDKKKLASIIFSDKVKLQTVNEIIHPEVIKDFYLWAEQQKKAPVVAHEAAILFESGFNELMDKTLTVFAPLEDRICRTMKRDNTGREHVLERINSQMSDDEKISLSDFVIYNDGSQSLIEQAQSILRQIQNS
ncbi:dephospho-CoA kinase [Dysgonomonas sp. 520]|uniref:dephospho-CoA kinase n=1 Tax=Dysgonomonas sp. 520 TaxID=2302931 RepID=UPI0013D0D8B7|nr:dephospho-CoA kinase [Dysgonomonas sp. 520]NDW09879.1 dephospho-CoA kinase [Dysgonomonas sp. 520]